MSDSEVRPWWCSGGGAHLEIVERQLGLPVIDREELVPGSGQRFGIGPGEERPAVDCPIERAASPRDGEMIVAARLDADVGARRLAPCAVFVLPADDRQRVSPSAEDQDVPRG